MLGEVPALYEGERLRVGPSASILETMNQRYTVDDAVV